MRDILLFIITPVLMSVGGEFILKFVVSGQDLGLNMTSLLFIVQSPMLLVGVCLIVSSAILWITGMSIFQLSFMYPFLSLSYVLIIVGSDLFLHENVGLNRYVSILLIITGLVIISRSQNAKVED